MTGSPARHVFRLMQAALNDLPDQYTERLANLSFGVSRTLSLRDRRRLGVRGTLYGLYEGIPLTRRTSAYDRAVPDIVTLFWGPLVRDFPGDAELEDQVRKTVYHEIAHYFGLSEDDLHDTRVR
jgi:predicted Zn-dependent protease with MMP-like domain